MAEEPPVVAPLIELPPVTPPVTPRVGDPSWSWGPSVKFMFAG